MSIAINKLDKLKSWLETACSLNNFELLPLVNDASFRQYFRVQTQHASHVAMLAPPRKKELTTFISIAKDFTEQGIHAPRVFNYDLEQGFMLLSDLGNDLYLNLLTAENADDLYQRALAVIPQIQRCKPTLDNHESLSSFDEKFIRTELNLFSNWFLDKHLKLDITPKLNAMLEKIFQLLVAATSKQPYVCVHRDYHSRNLLLINEGKVGILDFQDALYGPITYDAVSLLRDAYIDWPENQVQTWVLSLHEMLKVKHPSSNEEFMRWFDLTGVQRHLKVLGIFARLSYQDNKPQYLANTSRLLGYLQHVCDKYPELDELKILLESNIHNKLSKI